MTPRSSIKALGVAARVHPAVAHARRPAQRDVGVAPDQDRERLARHRVDADARDVVVLPVELEEASREETAQDLDHLVHAPAPCLPVGPGHLEVLGPGRETHPEAEAVAGEHRHRGRLLGDQHGLPNGQLDDEGREPQALSHRAEGRDQREGLEERLVGQNAAVAVGRVGVLRI